MAAKPTEVKASELQCCPELLKEPVCDTLNLRYRLPFRPRVGNQPIPVEVVLHFRLERCSGPLVIGDPIYSTTLFPGERVRLFTSDRHARWSFDSESNLAYRHETTSEESFFTAGMAESMSDLTVNQSGVSVSSYGESWAEGGGGASFSLFGVVEIGGGGSAGSYNSQSLSAFSRSLSQHAESSSRYVAASVRAKSSSAVGEVERRTHSEGESESHFESSSRTFTNPNKCRAITYFFHKLHKLQIIRFQLVAIERRVEDPAAPTGAYQRVPVDTTGRLTVLPQAIPATSKNRLELENAARSSAAERLRVASSVFDPSQTAFSGVAFNRKAIFTGGDPITNEVRQAALSAVDEDLAKEGILDVKTGNPGGKFIAQLSWERKEILPTPGVIVKGCLDDCQTCEPELQKEMALDLERKQLENHLLEKQIEFLEKSQEYRCCPKGEEEVKEPV